MAKNDFQSGWWNSYTLQCGMSLWEHNSEFTKWQHLQCDTWLCDHDIEFAQTSAILEFHTWFRFRPYHRSRRHVILHQSAKFLSKSDHPRQKKMTSCRFSRWRTSAILDFRAPRMGSLKTTCTISYSSSIEIIALNCLVFEKNRYFLHYGDRQTDKHADRRTDSIGALSRSRCRERRLKNRDSRFISEMIRQMTRKWYKAELYLQQQTDRKSYMTYWNLQFSMTLNDP